MAHPYLLAAVRREHRRLTVVCQSMDRRNLPAAVVALLEDAMLTLDDAAQLLENLDPAAPLLEERPEPRLPDPGNRVGR